MLNLASRPISFLFIKFAAEKKHRPGRLFKNNSRLSAYPTLLSLSPSSIYTLCEGKHSYMPGE